MKKEGYRRKTTFEKKNTPGLARVCPSRPGHGSTVSLHRPVFWQTRIGPATGFQVDPSDLSRF